MRKSEGREKVRAPAKRSFVGKRRDDGAGRGEADHKAKLFPTGKMSQKGERRRSGVVVCLIVGLRCQI